MIQLISFKEMLPFWKTFLWPDRTSAIEPCSAILYGSYPYKISMQFMDEECFCFGAFEDDALVGVNSGHVTDNSFRSRGLFVLPDYRKSGYGTALLDATIDKGRELGREFVWSMPRKTSMTTYESAGFIQTSDWFGTETSDNNCFVKIDIKE